MNDKTSVLQCLSEALYALGRVAVYDEMSCLNKGGAMQRIREAIECLTKSEIKGEVNEMPPGASDTRK